MAISATERSDERRRTYTDTRSLHTGTSRLPMVSRRPGADATPKNSAERISSIVDSRSAASEGQSKGQSRGGIFTPWADCPLWRGQLRACYLRFYWCAPWDSNPEPAD